MYRYSWPLLSLAALAAYVNWQGHDYYPIVNSDPYRYVAIAQQPFGSPNPFAHDAPYAWRLLTPLLAHLLPVPILTGFWVLTLCGLAGATFAMMWFLHGLGFSQNATIDGGLAFVFLMPATAFTLFDDRLVDPLAFALLTLALAACVHRLGWLMLASLAICALDKETAILGVIFALAWSWQQRDRTMLCWSLASLGTVLAFLITLRILIPASSYDLRVVLISYILQAMISPIRLLMALAGAWGILLPLAFAARVFWRTPAYWLVWLAATAQVLVSHDIERVVVYAFPVMIAASCSTIDILAARWHFSTWWLWIPVLTLELSWPYTYAPDYFFTLASLRLSLMVTYSIAAITILCFKIRGQLREKRPQQAETVFQ